MQRLKGLILGSVLDRLHKPRAINRQRTVKYGALLAAVFYVSHILLTRGATMSVVPEVVQVVDAKGHQSGKSH